MVEAIQQAPTLFKLMYLKPAAISINPLIINILAKDGATWPSHLEVFSKVASTLVRRYV